MRQDSVLLALGSYPWMCENVACAASTLWSRGSWLGGALVSALCICCFLAHRFLYGTLWFVVPLLSYIAIPISEVIQCYHLSLFSIVHELISWPPAVLVLFLFLVCVFCFLVVFCLFCLDLFFLCLLFVLHGDSSMDYVSIQFSSLLSHIVIMTNVATALIRWICTMQLSFRLDKRPGESHLALDGKKHFFLSCCEKATGEDIKQTSHYRSVKKIFASASTSFIQIQFFLQAWLIGTELLRSAWFFEATADGS